MINITFNPNTYTVDITGHSNHGKKGEDIVCSAISTLFYTLGESLFASRFMMAEDVVFEGDEGSGHITCDKVKSVENCPIHK